MRTQYSSVCPVCGRYIAKNWSHQAQRLPEPIRAQPIHWDRVSEAWYWRTVALVGGFKANQPKVTRYDVTLGGTKCINAFRRQYVHSYCYHQGLRAWSLEVVATQETGLDADELHILDPLHKLQSQTAAKLCRCPLTHWPTIRQTHNDQERI